MASSRESTNSSNRSVTNGSLRSTRASGEISTGCPVTNVGRTRSASHSFSNSDSMMRPVPHDDSYVAPWRSAIARSGVDRHRRMDRLADLLGHRPRHRQPRPRLGEVDLLAADRHDGRAERVAGGLGDQLLGDRHHVGPVGERLVQLHHRELGVVAGGDALVAEDPADLEHPLHAAHDQPLEVQLERDPEVEVHRQRVVVGRERPGMGATGLDVQHRCLDLDEALGVERAPEAGDVACRISKCRRASSLTIRSAYRCRNRVSGSVRPCHLSGSGRTAFDEQLHAVDLDRQLAGAGRHDRAVDADPVAEIELLDVVERRRRRSPPSTRTAGPVRHGREWSRTRACRCRGSSITRPATSTSASVSLPGSSAPHSARTSASVCERSKRYGIRLVAALAELGDATQSTHPLGGQTTAALRFVAGERLGAGRFTHERSDGSRVLPAATPCARPGRRSLAQVMSAPAARSRFPPALAPSSSSRRSPPPLVTAIGGAMVLAAAHRRRRRHGRHAPPIVSIRGLDDVAVVFDLQEVDQFVVEATFRRRRAGRCRGGAGRTASVGHAALTRGGALVHAAPDGYLIPMVLIALPRPRSAASSATTSPRALDASTVVLNELTAQTTGAQVGRHARAAGGRRLVAGVQRRRHPARTRRSAVPSC